MKSNIFCTKIVVGVFFRRCSHQLGGNMKKSRNLALALASALVLIFTGCGSTPEEENTSPVEEAVVESPSNNTIEALLASLEESRQKAIEAGAEGLNPLAFKAAEAEYLALIGSGNTPGSDKSAALKDLNARYRAMEAYSKAVQKKEFIEAEELMSYNKKAYDDGCKMLVALDDATAQTLSGNDFLAKAKAAEVKFDDVLNAAYKVLAKEERTNAFEAKKYADSVKAAVAAKEKYNKGVTAFKTGDTNYVTGAPQEAYYNYIEAKVIFTELYETIYPARQRAQAHIDEAKELIAESEEMAEQADVQAPLDDSAEGIEDEETKLLEEDDFTEAKNAQVELEETLKEGE